jgi:hypothetical protein
MSAEQAQLRLAQTSAEYARRLMLFPTSANLALCVPYLERACTCLESLKRSLASPGRHSPELASGLHSLRDVARRAAALLESAAAFHAGWYRTIMAPAFGYTRTGELTSPAPQQSLSIEG